MVFSFLCPWFQVVLSDEMNVMLLMSGNVVGQGPCSSIVEGAGSMAYAVQRVFRQTVEKGNGGTPHRFILLKYVVQVPAICL